MTIKYKLNLITAIVLSFALIIIALTLSETISNNKVIEQTKELNELSVKLSILIHETQKERDAVPVSSVQMDKNLETFYQSKELIQQKSMRFYTAT